MRAIGANRLACSLASMWTQQLGGAEAAALAAAAAPCAPVVGTRNAHTEVVLALGSNQGNRVENLLTAVRQMPQYGVDVLRVSLLYETAPASVMEQPSYLNAAVLAKTDLLPLQLLYNVKQMEKAAGRDLVGGIRHGPRPLDVDIVFFGNSSVQHESLTVPHISWQERAFVKAPIADLLQPRDLEAGCISERGDPASALPRLRTLCDMWQREGGHAQVGQPGLVHVLPVHRQIWELGTSTHIMGILNVTPDSFSDGGRHHETHAAVEHARAMAVAGASIIDVGGQSTRPGAARVTPQEELARVLPVIRALRDDSQMVHVAVSVDTFYAEVAAAAVAAGADMVNDVSGGTLDADMWGTVADLGVPYVLMHMRGDPGTMLAGANSSYPGGVVAEVGAELAASAEAAIAAGILPWNLLLDPGIGFAKQPADSIQLLAGLGRMRREALPGVLSRVPLLVGSSRKGFLGKLTGHERPEDRDVATVAACTAAVAQGADIVRVHNVRMVADGLAVADAVFRGLPPQWQPVAAAGS